MPCLEPTRQRKHMRQPQDPVLLEQPMQLPSFEVFALSQLKRADFAKSSGFSVNP
jgi:hypothetical protein